MELCDSGQSKILATILSGALTDIIRLRHIGASQTPSADSHSYSTSNNHITYTPKATVAAGCITLDVRAVPYVLSNVLRPLTYNNFEI